MGWKLTGAVFFMIGDERPCGRCIKRGLQDSCHDGTRKKAKYLHDAPNEALMPGLVNHRFNGLVERRAALAGQHPLPEAALNMANRQTFYIPNQPMPPPPPQQPYGVFMPDGMQPQMPPPSEFGSQPSPISPTFPAGTSQQSTPLQIHPGALPQSSPLSQTRSSTAFAGPLPDAHDPALLDFDLAGLNFVNHYGALEFGMLGHMSSGAMETPPMDETVGLGPSGAEGTEFTPSQMAPSAYVPPTLSSANYMYGNEATMSDVPESNGRRPSLVDPSFLPHNDNMTNERPNSNMAHGYTIGAGPSSMLSPGSHPQGVVGPFGPSSSNGYSPPNHSSGGHPNAFDHPTHQLHQPSSAVDLQHHAGPSRRARDPSSIYDSVTEPYSYTAGFHALTAFLQRRFPPHKTLRIAKALASIRPSFISCTKPLNQQDLIFMEKCFQRTLWEYEDFINACATPTIVCRRTGEVAAVGKEFSILTGWKKEVLLGKEANWNINIGGSPGHASTGTSPGGSTTPRLPEAPKPGVRLDGDGRPQPVFLAELLDDDSVIKFYEDFAKLAFGDSRGSVITRCKLLKYRTTEGLTFGRDRDEELTGAFKVEEDGLEQGPNGRGKMGGNELQKVHSRGNDWDGKGIHLNGDGGHSIGGIAGEGSIHRLESQDGTVDCICCWTVKRDVFDIPMLIVMNVSVCQSDLTGESY